jgi:hypothetical protein
MHDTIISQRHVTLKITGNVTLVAYNVSIWVSLQKFAHLMVGNYRILTKV